jgi:ABC-type multidrug transport system fused ATPase/permease subunit
MAILLILGKRCFKGHLSFGVFMLFMHLSFRSYVPSNGWPMCKRSFSRLWLPILRIYEVLETKPTVVEKTDALELETIKDKIEIEKA